MRKCFEDTRVKVLLLKNKKSSKASLCSNGKNVDPYFKLKWPKHDGYYNSTWAYSPALTAQRCTLQSIPLYCTAFSQHWTRKAGVLKTEGAYWLCRMDEQVLRRSSPLEHQQIIKTPLRLEQLKGFNLS